MTSSEIVTATDLARITQKNKILNLLEENEEKSTRDIADSMKHSKSHIQNLLKEMREEGAVIARREGEYQNSPIFYKKMDGLGEINA